MLYTMGRWTCPSANVKTTQKNWDRAFLPKDQFEALYGPDEVDAAVPQDEQ